MTEIDPLIEVVITELAGRPEERRRSKEILRIQEKLKTLGSEATNLLIELEAHVNAREALAVDVALKIGFRAGQADAYAAHLDDETAELVAEVALVGLNLSKLSRLQAIAEALRLELADDDDVFDR